MGKSYNKEEYDGIKKLIAAGKYELAKTALEDYLERYPNNSYALKEYSCILRHQNRQHEALSLLLQCNSAEVHIICERAFCYAYSSEYEMALTEIAKLYNPNAVERKLKSFCSAKLGWLPEEANQFYGLSQIMNYDSEKAISHINDRYSSVDYIHFSEELNLEELYHNIRELLPEAKCTIYDDIMMYYIFRVESAGFIKGEKADYVTAVAPPYSTDIFTIYLTQNEHVLKPTVNDYQTLIRSKEKVEEPVKVKQRQSQIEKFNRRYGK